MGKQKNLSRFAAVILAVCMTFGMIVVPAAAFAEGETAAAGQPSIETEQTYEVVVQADDDHPPLDNPVELPSISSTDSGLLVTAGDDKTAEVTVDGSVTAEDLGIYVISDGEGSKVDLDVTGPVTSEDDAVTVEVLNGGSATVVTGYVQTKDTEKGGSDPDEIGDGVVVIASGDSTADVKTGAITSGASGVTVEADSGAFVKVNVGGELDAAQDGVFIQAEGEGTTVIVNDSEGINAVNEGLQIEVKDGAEAGGLVGPVTSTADNAFGVWIETTESQSGPSLTEESGSAAPADDRSEGSSMPDPVTVPDRDSMIPGTEKPDAGDSSTVVSQYTGNVTAYAGVHVESSGGTAGLQTGDIKVTGGNVKLPEDVQEGDTPVFDVVANGVIATNGGTVTLNTGNIDSAGCGVNVYTRSDGIATVNTGNIEAEEIGFHIDNEGGVTWTEAGSITSVMEAIGITMVGEDSASIAFVDGMATSSEGSAIRISNDKGNLFVAVTGDAVSEVTDPAYVERAGLTYYGEGDTKVLVVGTLSGYDGVQIMDDASTEGLDLTVWKIDKAADGEYITGDDAKESFAKSVSYIVMLEQPFAGATVSATKDDGSPLDKKYGDSEQTGFEVANQDQKVLLSVDLEKGYRLTGAYNGMEDRMALQKDEAGNYYLMVPMGGGVYFTVELSLVPEPSPQPEPVPQPAEGSTVVADYASYSRVAGEEAISATVLAEDGQPVQASIRIRFYGDGRFSIVIDGGAFRVRGSYGTINGALTLTLLDGTSIPINSDGTFVIVLENGMRLVLHLENTVIQEFIKA